MRSSPGRALTGLVVALATLSLQCACQKSSREKQSATSAQTTPRPSAPEAVSPPKKAEEAPSSTPNPEPSTPEKRRRYTVAALGDSITDARSGGGGYLKVLRATCPRSLFLDFGKGGDMTNQMRRRFEQEILPRIASEGIDTLLVYGGVNDLYSDLTAGRTNEQIEKDLTAIYQTAHERSLLVVAITVSPWGGFKRYWNPRRGDNTKLLNSWILGQVARGPVDIAVDSFAPLSCGDPDVLCPDYETRFHDGLHPGEKGHEILGKKLAQEAFPNCL